MLPYASNANASGSITTPIRASLHVVVLRKFGCKREIEKSTTSEKIYHLAHEFKKLR